jgi:hypothetical protein
MLFMQYIFVYPLNHDLWITLFQGLWILMKVPLMSLIQAWNSGIYIPRVIHSSIVAHRISWASLVDARCNENYIITYIRFVPITKECIIRDYIVMFHA